MYTYYLCSEQCYFFELSELLCSLYFSFGHHIFKSHVCRSLSHSNEKNSKVSLCVMLWFEKVVCKVVCSTMASNLCSHYLGPAVAWLW